MVEFTNTTHTKVWGKGNTGQKRAELAGKDNGYVVSAWTVSQASGDVKNEKKRTFFWLSLILSSSHVVSFYLAFTVNISKCVLLRIEIGGIL